jgi:predicted ATPase/serine/threonine protein kinase
MSSAASSPIGTTLAGRYELVAPLGDGGMGAVYAGRQLSTGRRVAVKLIHPHLATRPVVVKRFEREMLASCSVEHPNVVQVFDYGTAEGGVPFLVMELLEGCPLSEILAETGPMSPERAVGIAVQIARALVAIHSAGIIHRDLKPQNIVVGDRHGERDRITVLDFGIAHFHASDTDEQLTLQGQTMGTAAYMAPEQATGDPIDARADLYALGVVLYKMLTCELPFSAPTALVMMSKKVYEPATPPSRHLAQPLPADLEGLVCDLLATVSRDRPSDAAAVIARLSQLAFDEGIGPVLIPRPFGPEVTQTEGLYRISGDTWVDSEMAAPRSLALTRYDFRATSSFVGRSSELRAIRAQVRDGARLVTLTGTGGIGKTRLSREFGAVHGEDFSSGALFVDVSDARTVDALCVRIAGVLRVPLTGDDAVDRVGAALDALGRVCVILDNFEQLVDTAHAAVSRWLEVAPEVCLLVTSRERLHIAGERTLELSPLEVPAAVDADLEGLARVDAVALFVDRARAVVPEFSLDGSNAAAVVEIIRRLDGIPLAIELAAERLRLFEPVEICERLADRFKLLRGRRRDAPERQGTMRAAIDWSWALLQPWQQAAMAQCSVFAGGATLRTLDAVLDLSPWPEAPWTEDVVQTLLDKSILTRQGSRFSMYESIREYAAERLVDAGVEDPVAAATATRHTALFARLGDPDYLASLHGPEGGRRLRTLTLESENLQAALRVAMDAGDAATAAALASGILALIDLEGPYLHGVEIADHVLGLEGLAESDALRLELNAGILLRQATRLDEAAVRLGRARDLAVRQGAVEAEARAYLEIGTVHSYRGELEASYPAYERALELSTQAGSRWLTGLILGTMGTCLAEAEVARAERCFDQALAIAREVGDRRHEGWQLSNLALARWELGDVVQAKSAFLEAIDLARETNDARMEAILHYNLADLARDAGDLGKAATLYADALALLRRVGARSEQVLLLQDRAKMRRDAGEVDGAREDFGVALALADEIGMASFGSRLRLGLAELSCEEGDEATARRYLQEVRASDTIDEDVAEQIATLQARLSSA